MRTDIAAVLAKHPGLVHRMRFVRLSFEIRSSSDRLHVEVDGSRVTARRITGVEPSPPAEFVIEAPESAWAAFSRPQPRPGLHDVIPMIETRHAQLSGEGLGFFRNQFLVRAIVSAVFTGDARW